MEFVSMYQIARYNRWLNSRVLLKEDGVLCGNYIDKKVSFPPEGGDRTVVLMLELRSVWSSSGSFVGSVTIDRVAPSTLVSRDLYIEEKYRGFGLSKLLFRLENELCGILYGGGKRMLAFVRSDNEIQRNRLKSLGWKLVDDSIEVGEDEDCNGIYSEMWMTFTKIYPNSRYHIKEFEISRRLGIDSAPTTSTERK